MIDFDFSPFFKRYEAISAMADQVFEKVRREHPDEVRCHTKCADCCHALFDLSLIEAVYIHQRFHKELSGERLEGLLEKANVADRRIYKIKRKAYQDAAAGKDEEKIIEALALERERCPMLDEKELCEVYDYRPITCRLYGIPTAIGGKGHTCGKSGFVKGNPYPTVNLDQIQKMLYDLSRELALAIKSKHVKIGELLVPLSMALLADYNEEYFGVASDEEKKADADQPDSADKGGSSG